MADLDPGVISDPSDSSEVLDAFLEYLIEAGIEPYDHQEEAILELFEGKNVILNTPTGSGKSSWRWLCTFAPFAKSGDLFTPCQSRPWQMRSFSRFVKLSARTMLA